MNCCEKELKKAQATIVALSDSRAQDGDRWQCPKCGQAYVYVCDEAEGCCWQRVTGQPKEIELHSDWAPTLKLSVPTDPRNLAGTYLLSKGHRMCDKIDAGIVQDYLVEYTKLIERRLESIMKLAQDAIKVQVPPAAIAEIEEELERPQHAHTCPHCSTHYACWEDFCRGRSVEVCPSCFQARKGY